MNLKGKDLDDFFRKELSNADIPFEEAHWLRLEKRLARKKQKHTIVWITLSGIAAMLLLTLTVSKIFFADEKTQPIAKSVKKPVQNSTPDSLFTIKEDHSTQAALEETRETSKNLTNLAITSTSSNSLDFRVKNRDEEKTPEKINVSPGVLVTKLTFKDTSTVQPTIIPPAEASQSTGQKNNQGKVLVNSNPTQVIPKKDTAVTLANTPVSTGSPFSLSLMAGPDINGVNTLKSSRGGVSVGLMLNYKFSRKLSVTTGALYAKKLYNTRFEYYKPNSSYVFPNAPKIVNADCRVLDIPLNVNYTAFSNTKDAIALSAGVSSYLMLKEGYSFTYETPATRGPRTYQIDNRNKHYLGILNFGAAYERKISDEVSIGVQPYLKIPVTDIGYGRVKLLSTGILTSVKLNISSKNK